MSGWIVPDPDHLIYSKLYSNGQEDKCRDVHQFPMGLEENIKKMEETCQPELTQRNFPDFESEVRVHSANID